MIKKYQKTITAYEFPNGFVVELSQDNDCMEFWLYHKRYGIKDMMFGIPNEFEAAHEEIMLANVQQHMDYYKKKYMDFEISD